MNIISAIKSKISKPKTSLSVQNIEGIDTYAFMAKTFVNKGDYKVDEPLKGTRDVFLDSLKLGSTRIGITFHFKQTPGRSILDYIVVFERDVLLHSIRWEGSRATCIGLGFQVDALENWASQ